nr:MAG TPA: hypothetical protein [Caudoviricetes sp.]
MKTLDFSQGMKQRRFYTNSSKKTADASASW